MESLGDILRRLPLPENRASSDSDAAAEPHEAENYSCGVCRDAGFVHPAGPGGRPDYSRVEPCHCALTKHKQGRLDVMHRYSNLGPLADRTFDSFVAPSADAKNPSPSKLARALQIGRAFAENPEGWLVFIGPTGTGKTHLAAAIANHRLAGGHAVMFVSTPDLLDHLRATFHPSSAVSYDELFERVKNTPLLVLDDLGLQSSTPWSTEKLDQIINHRFNSRLATVYTSSVQLEDLEDRWSMRLGDPKLSRVVILGEKPEAPLEDPAEMAHLRDMTFDNFRSKRTELLLEDRQTLETAFSNAREFARQPEGWLILAGPHGSGKTHLAAAIVNARLKEGKAAAFMFVPDLLDHLRSTFAADSKVSYDDFFERVKKAPLLVLDDLGGHVTSPWAQEKLYQLINYRYNARLATVFTIISRDDLEERVRSRLDDDRLVIFTPPITVAYYSGSPSSEPKPNPSQRGRIRNK